MASCGSGLSSKTLTWSSSDGTRMEGTLLLPNAEPESVVILVHGSGNMHRGIRWYERQAENITKVGAAVLYYDKRGTGESGGDWKKADLDQLTDDAVSSISSIRILEGLEDIKVGLLGYSQGGWIIVKATEKADVDFLISVSGSTQTPGEQGKYVTRNAMQRNGFSEEDMELADSLTDMINRVYLTDEGWQETQTKLEKSVPERFEGLGFGLMPRDHWNWKWYAELPLDFDPRPIMEKSNVPMLAFHGSRDHLVDPDFNAAYLGRLKSDGLDVTTHVDPEGGHILKYRKKHMIFWNKTYWKDAYYQTMTDWLRDRDFLADE